MAFVPASKQRSEGGVALFMVVSAVAVLSLLVTEFTYLSQLNQKIAFDSLDQVKVHYLAKSALKFSLLRLKAYQQVKALTGSSSNQGEGGAIPGIPRSIIEKIWSFPFVYPVPTTLPGMSLTDQETIEEFQKESSLEGNFSALIESESSKYNLNLLLAPYLPKPQPSPSPSPSATPFDPEAAQRSLGEYLQQLLNNKVENDPDFGEEYRDFRIEDLTDYIRAWVDPTFERTLNGFEDGRVAIKKAPFFSLSELHMIPTLNDELYEVFAPSLTTSPTPGINVNSMTELTLRSLFPAITLEEAKDLIQFRDLPDADNLFKTVEDFYQILQKYAAAYQSDSAMSQVKTDLAKRHIRFVVDETQFKITVRASINQSSRLIEAWVTLLDPKKAAAPTQPNAPVGGARGAFADTDTLQKSRKTAEDAGLKITFMRIL